MSPILILAAAAVVAAGFFAVAFVLAAKRQAVPSRDLASAIRVLDRILAYDDAVPSLSTELRTEAKRVVANYHKELN